MGKVICFNCYQTEIKLKSRENQIEDQVHSFQRIIVAIQHYNEGKIDSVNYLLEAIFNESVRHA